MAAILAEVVRDGQGLGTSWQIRSTRQERRDGYRAEPV